MGDRHFFEFRHSARGHVDRQEGECDDVGQHMVGGGQGAFIGAVHRLAQRLDGDIELVAGAMHADPEIAVASALELGIAEDRAHRTWMDLLEDEKKRPEDERIDFVTIVTPNFLHAPIALAFVQADAPDRAFGTVSTSALFSTRLDTEYGVQGLLFAFSRLRRRKI